VDPFFSIVITTYNRRDVVSRCIESCLRQSYERSYDVVVVDDCSTDGTVAALRERWPNEITLIEHAVNLGINPSRHTAVSAARGEWILVVDSDWTLRPDALARLHDVIRDAPPSVRAVRARLRWDDGHVSPSFMPRGPVGYLERIKWVDEEGGDDALSCIHRSVVDIVPFIRDRRGTVEELYELDLAKAVVSVYTEAVVGEEFTDAHNSYMRTTERRALIPQLLRDAPDLLWMTETALQRHGNALRRHGPWQYTRIVRMAAAKSFLVGDRRKGLRYSRVVLRRRPMDGLAWITLGAGVFGPRAFANATWIFRLGVSFARRRVRWTDAVRTSLRLRGA
jgi:glycosyltransferase involved in cell wall biosynthesis